MGKAYRFGDHPRCLTLVQTRRDVVLTCTKKLALLNHDLFSTLEALEGRRRRSDKTLFEDAVEALTTLSNDPQWRINGYRNVWIVKPGALARGNGIKVHRNFHRITRVCESKIEVNDPLRIGQKKLSSSWIVQKYIENPLLVPLASGYHKHDLRVWVVVSCDEDDLFAWIWTKPYIRIAACPWDRRGRNMKEANESARPFRDDEDSAAMHLTNFSVSKKAVDSAQFIWQLERYKAFVEEEAGDGFWAAHLWPRIKEVSRQALLWIKPQLDPLRPNSFQLLGYDLLVTEDWKVWLIEVNAAPDLSLTWPGKKTLLERLWEEMLQLIIDEPRAEVTEHFERLHPFPRQDGTRLTGLRASQQVYSTRRRHEVTPPSISPAHRLSGNYDTTTDFETTLTPHLTLNTTQGLKSFLSPKIGAVARVESREVTSIRNAGNIVPLARYSDSPKRPSPIKSSNRRRSLPNLCINNTVLKSSHVRRATTSPKWGGYAPSRASWEVEGSTSPLFSAIGVKLPNNIQHPL